MEWWCGGLRMLWYFRSRAGLARELQVVKGGGNVDAGVRRSGVAPIY